MSHVPQIQTILNQTEEKMKKVLEKMRYEFSTMRTGRASGSLIEGVKADYYGTKTPINQMAAIGVPDGRTIEIKPWDVSSMPAIEKAIHTQEFSRTGISKNTEGK